MSNVGTLLRVEAWAKRRKLELISINFNQELVVVRDLDHPPRGVTYTISYADGLG